MSQQPAIEPDDDEPGFVDDPEFTTAPWSLDELDVSADLGSVRSAWSGSTDDHDL